jgi:soluble lytic murein transglycosylase-like protein
MLYDAQQNIHSGIFIIHMVHGNRTYIVISIVCTAALLWLTVLSVSADIYMYIDQDGHYYFTDSPKSSKYRLFIKERRIKPSRSTFANKYDTIAKEAARRHGVDFRLVKAIMKVESNFNPQAVSKAGAKGLMQIMPENFRALRINNPFDPWENIMGGTRYIKQLINRFNGNLRLALAAYNAGPNSVDPLNGIPNITETREFVEKVIQYYNGLKGDSLSPAYSSAQ